MGEYLNLQNLLSLYLSLSLTQKDGVLVADSQRRLTSVGAGSSSIMCACEFISGPWGGALSRSLCARSHVEGTCLGTHSKLNPRTIETKKD